MTDESSAEPQANSINAAECQIRALRDRWTTIITEVSLVAF
jgi:hypothetical protein